ncbi:MAG: nuclease-related domain-containing protein [Thermaceae bacterium]
MARTHGRAGGTLARKLGKQALILLIWGGLVFLLGTVAFPASPFLSAFLALLGVIWVLSGREVKRGLAAKVKGYIGEAKVGRILEELPEGFRVFHDVDLGGENADHVVVGPGGVFAVEVKNYSGHIQARPDGLYVNGKRNDRVIRQAWRQAHKLGEWLGVEVEPVLVFVGGNLEGERVGRLPVLRPEGLKVFLARAPRKLSYQEARRIFGLLKGKVR